MASYDIDQAAGLRRMLERPVPRLFTFLSVLGEEEKSAMLINLAASLSQAGHQVLLVDGGVASSGLLTRIGLRHDVATLQEVARMERPLHEAVRLLPEGFSMARIARRAVPAAGHPQAGRLVSIFDTLIEQAEITLVNGVLAEDDSFPVSTMEMGEIVIQLSTSASSIKAAYVLLKSLTDRIGRRPFSLIINDATEAEAQTVYANMAQAASRYLAAQLNFLGSVPADDHIRRACGQGRAVMDVFPFAGASIAFHRLAKQLAGQDAAKSAYGMATDGASLGV
ncbi:flagellar biosynthesis protein FlhG [Herbaspirillum sp. SJZ130]|nr:flagellar biosynthesis protein FlhG [Herbaspirillum sp. SJZ102]TQK04452.1 flagellar biosynthesis protein FlhG [Herbaspirillum sp. SJZ130]TQK09763.1 flagellar biosynthesis protein FlhG [Herbaspirillum sp. SJZ106]TWC65887.1 flagellar biosynthesis protein FlhG [Herbaspirillum sp. SJZ099]